MPHHWEWDEVDYEDENDWDEYEEDDQDQDQDDPTLLWESEGTDGRDKKRRRHDEDPSHSLIEEIQTTGVGASTKEDERHLKLFHLQGDFPINTFGAPQGALETPWFDTQTHIQERQRNALSSMFSLVMRIYLAKQVARFNTLFYDSKKKLITSAEHEGVVVDTTAPVGHLLSFPERSRLQAAALGIFSPGSDDFFTFVTCTRDLRRAMSAMRQIKRNRKMAKSNLKKRKAEVKRIKAVYGFALG